MTKRLKRLAGFDLALSIKDQDFIRPPRDSQRNWLLNQAMNEFAHDVLALDHLAQRFVPGSEQLHTDDRTQAELNELDIMEDWQIPVMQAMAATVARDGGDILEIGFGRGVGSGFLQQQPIASHTIIECNDHIVNKFQQWRQQYPHKNINLVHGLWQEKLPTLGSFDGIFFHTYPLKESDYVEQIAESITFAEHFFPHAAAHLRPGGRFTYLSNEMDSLSRAHQRLLFQHFSTIEISRLDALPVPQNVRDQWWSDSMIIVKAVK